MSAPRVSTRQEVSRQRRRRAHGCWGHLIVAPLWPKHGVNLGTLLRTCDAVGACMAVPKHKWVPEALDRGNTLRRPSCVHWVNDPRGWLLRERAVGTRIFAVELADEAIRLGDLPAAGGRSIALLGHETYGIPEDVLDLVDVAVEIPMIGSGISLNVAVAGSLVLYKLAGML
ncbi:RNA methyltransferase [Fodinicola feengrottensis]|uniref:RNA methyltransferase n=1 Tax=Fodinicola feengrottensis TaxID=435914 RepID=UPI0013D3151A|nr:RNA methyltransferase [Fodinicola feengrottensis]